MEIGLDGNEANVRNRVGSGVYAFELLKEFSKNQHHNFSVYLKNQPLEDFPKATDKYRYKVFGPQKLWTRFALPLKLTFGSKPKVFFSMGHYGPFVSKAPYAVTIFDLSYLHYPQMFNKDDLYQLTNWSKRSILNSKHIFAISQNTKTDIVKSYGVSPQKITVTYMGYDQKRFKPQPKPKIEAIKTKYKIKGDYIIFVGTLQPRKNIVRLIEAFALVTRDQGSETSNLKLVIVGRKGWLYEPIYQKVKNLGIQSKVVFTDYIPDSDLPPLISGAKAYVLPSLWEGFGIPVIEAQACGVPVVVSNTSSLPEVIGAQDYSPSHPELDSGSKNIASAILVNPESTVSIAEGIEKVDSDDKLAHTLIQKGLQNAKRFSWQKCAQLTLKTLENL